MKYVSEKYERRLIDLAEKLAERRRQAAPQVGQLILFESEMGNTTMAEVVPFPTAEELPDGAA